MSTGTYTFLAVDLASKFGFEDGEVPEAVAEGVYDVHGWNQEGYRQAHGRWQPGVLVPLIVSTLVPGLPFPVDVMRFLDDTSTHNPVRVETVDGHDVGRRGDPEHQVCRDLLAPYTLTVPLSFLIDAILGNARADLLAGIPLDVIAAASAAGLPATEISALHRAGHLTRESAKNLAVLAALRS